MTYHVVFNMKTKAQIECDIPTTKDFNDMITAVQNKSWFGIQPANKLKDAGYFLNCREVEFLKMTETGHEEPGQGVIR